MHLQNLKKKLYHIENSESRGQIVDPDELAHHKIILSGSMFFANSAGF